MSQATPPPLPTSSETGKGTGKKKTIIIVLVGLALLALGVVTVTGIFVAIAIPALATARSDAQEAMAKSIVGGVEKAKARFEEKEGRSPSSWEELHGYLTIEGETFQTPEAFMERALPGATLSVQGINGPLTQISFPDGRSFEGQAPPKEPQNQNQNQAQRTKPQGEPPFTMRAPPNWMGSWGADGGAKASPDGSEMVGVTIVEAPLETEAKVAQLMWKDIKAAHQKAAPDTSIKKMPAEKIGKIEFAVVKIEAEGITKTIYMGLQPQRVIILEATSKNGVASAALEQTIRSFRAKKPAQVSGLARGPVPTPAMAVGLSLDKDPRRWAIAAPPQGGPQGILLEMTPGQPISSWDELSTNTIVFGQKLDQYVDAWAKGLSNSGVEITLDKKLPDGSRWIEYKSSQEKGMWRWFQGPDGVYGISYQTRPQTEAADRVSTWKSILEGASLGKNPQAR
jgi:hypothetical protein